MTHSITRRAMLAAAAAPIVARAVQAAPRPRSIRSCIFIFYYGGPSHLDTFDPKPKAPRRGSRPIWHHRHRRARFRLTEGEPWRKLFG